MKTLKFPKFLKLTLTLAMLCSSSIFAQGFDDGVVPPPSPIDNNLYLAMSAGLLFICYFFYKGRKQTKSI